MCLLVFIGSFIKKPAPRFLRKRHLLTIVEDAGETHSIGALSGDLEVLNLVSPVAETYFNVIPPGLSPDPLKAHPFHVSLPSLQLVTINKACYIHLTR